MSVDGFAPQIALDFTADTPHVFGCDGTLRHTAAWIAATLVYEDGALEAINMRRCSACNALLELPSTTIAGITAYDY